VNYEKYLNLRNQLQSNVQTGSGAWSTFSASNDYAHDLLYEYNFIKFMDNETIYMRYKEYKK